LAALLSAAAGAAPLPKQQGLPAELVIQDQPPLAEQIQRLEKMAAFTRQTAPKPGALDKVKSLFSGGQRTPLINLSQLTAAAEALKSKPALIAVQGIWEPGKDPSVASFSSRGVSCVLSLGPGVIREGLPEDLAGLPVRAEGLAQVQPNGVVTIQVAQLTPGGSLVDLRIGRAHQLEGQYQAAVDPYSEAARLAQAENYEFGAFAAAQAADLTWTQLKDEKTARRLYSAAWNLYSKRVRGQPLYYTWVQTPEGDWKQEPMAVAIADPLRRLEENGFWYKLVAGFVTVCGGNAGLALLLLAVVTRVLVYPLTKKQLASARDMQRLQPMMKALQEKHKDDKQKFQEEFWKLCQEHGVNPLGGCLPMIVQMPLLYFVYMGVRAYIVNLDHAGFLWVPSLAQPDMILLVIYTISQIAFGKVTQAQNPTAAVDPQQKQQQQMMTYMMPVMFFFLFQSFPAAFMLYWLGTNVAYLAQQLYYNRTAPPLDALPVPKQGGGGWFARMMSSGGKPGGQEQSPSDKSYEAKRAASEGKLTSKQEAEKRRKKKRWTRPR
jgi:YidC/Oxa1 family membrane protein insertase